jgi:hypothetical protein
LDNKVPELEDVILEPDFKGIQDGVASVVQAEVTRDGAVGKIVATKSIQEMVGVDVRIHCNGIHGK